MSVSGESVLDTFPSIHITRKKVIQNKCPVNGALSDITYVTSGVPQGSVLVSHRAQFWDLYSSCCTSTTSTKTFNRVFASLPMIALYIRIIYRKINPKIDHQIPQTDLI